jgi:ribonuclease VapC
MFIDASAIVAILLDEERGDELAILVARSALKLTSPIAIWEAIARLAREYGETEATTRVEMLLRDGDVVVVPITAAEARIASQARARYGAGRYGLNMGDCFAYACAKSNGVPMLFVGEDFKKTDIEDATRI